MAAIIPPLPPITISSIGAPKWRHYVVDALGQKLTKPMPLGLAQTHATRIGKKLAAQAIVAPSPVKAPAAEATASPTQTFRGYVPAPLIVGEISTSTKPYAVTVDFPASLHPADIDAAWPDVVQRAAAALYRHQVCMQQDDDLRPSMVMKMLSGWTVSAIGADDPAAPGTRLVIDPYTYGADALRVNSTFILGVLRGVHQSVAIGSAS